MRARVAPLYVGSRERRAFEARARRDSLAAAEAAGEKASDEARVLRELEAGMDDAGF